MSQNKDNSSIIKANCIKYVRDEIGDIEKVTLEESSTGKRKTVSASVLADVIKEGKISVHGIAINKYGELYITSRPKNKRPKNPIKSELLSIVKKIEQLEKKEKTNVNRNKIIKLKKKLSDLQNDDSYRDQYEKLIEQGKTKIY